ncbi:MAG: hypothetical protein IPJ01_12270 [Micavibrio sp.]|nr:hypothetical protein [Micavibrio sp.]
MTQETLAGLALAALLGLVYLAAWLHARHNTRTDAPPDTGVLRPPSKIDIAGPTLDQLARRGERLGRLAVASAIPPQHVSPLCAIRINEAPPGEFVQIFEDEAESRLNTKRAVYFMDIFAQIEPGEGQFVGVMRNRVLVGRNYYKKAGAL